MAVDVAVEEHVAVLQQRTRLPFECLARLPPAQDLAPEAAVVEECPTAAERQLPDAVQRNAMRPGVLAGRPLRWRGVVFVDDVQPLLGSDARVRRVEAETLREPPLERHFDGVRANLAERQRECLETVPHAHVRIWPQQPVLLDRRAREQGLRCQLVVQRGIRCTQRRQVADEERVRDVSVVLGRERCVSRVRVVPGTAPAGCPGARRPAYYSCCRETS